MSETESIELDKTQLEVKPLRVAFHTFGCRSNYADTVDAQAALLEQGALPCDLNADPDVLVVNTCTVTDAADKDAYKLIRKTKAKNPNVKIVVTGCMAEASKDLLLEMSEVDSVVGPGRRTDVVSSVLGRSEMFVEEVSAEENELVSLPVTRRVKKALPERKSISLSGNISTEIAGPGGFMGEVATRARYHLRVQEGCENSCTFCIIPFTRGRLSSRSMAEVLADIDRLTERGYREIVLTGTHLGGYGEDIGSSLYELLSEIRRANVSCRIRLSSIDPNDLTKDIVNLVAESDLFCRHLHICVQAFSDRTLKRMNRRYRLEDAEKILWYCYEKCPELCIGSDLITGFPGESRQEVDQGIEKFLRLPISYLHVFPYSERSGTAAVNLKDVVDPAERKRRSARWRAISQRKHQSFMSGLLGQELNVIVERVNEDYAYGTSDQYASVKIPSGALEDLTSGVFEIGTLVSVTASSFDYDQGKLVCQL